MKTIRMTCAGVLLALVPICTHAEPLPEARYFISKAVDIDEVCLKQLLQLHENSGEPLDTTQLEQFKRYLQTCGWPTSPSAGMSGVNAAGELLLWAGADGAFQEQIIDMIQERVGVDLDALGYAWLNDKIQVQHGRPQQIGTLIAVEEGKVQLSPEPENMPRFWRDFMGMPPVDEWLESLQAKLDAGGSLGMAELSPHLAGEYRPLTQPELRRLVGRMINADQDARNAAIAALDAGDEELRKVLDQRIADVDGENIAILMEVFDEYGFPTPEMIGRDGVSSVFLLVQHADDNLAFQTRALELAKPLMERRGMSRYQYAMLTDRVLLAQDRPQLYGSQYTLEQGKVTVLPLADPKNVDARRAQMAMGTLASYLKAVAKQHAAGDD